jgi:2-dehydro-3-deoxygluconokinase
MKKVVTFGEIMLKLSAKGYQRLLQTKEMNVEYAGAEANVAVSLANFGVPVSYVSRLPENDLGHAACMTLRAFGVDTDSIAWGGNRLGIYFAEKGASQRPSKVVYDRAHSAISEATTADFDWKNIFKDAQWFHFTGITPALSQNVAEICMQACKQAKQMGLTVSCDLNYRSKLWTKEDAQKTMSRLAEYIDVCIANESDIADVFGIVAKNSDVEKGQLQQASYEIVAEQLLQKFNFQKVAITLRESISANDNNWSAMLFDGQKAFNSRKYAVHIVDRIGSGDAFAAGLIYGLNNGCDSQRTVDFAAAASCLKHSIEGDFNLVSKAEVESLMNNNYTGRIQR